MIETARQERIAHRVSRTMIRVYHGGFGDFSSSECWSPPVNVYRVASGLEVCFELAGVDPDRIEVRVEPGRLTIRGVRPSPEPCRKRDDAMRILAMEIDHGMFCREIPLPLGLHLAGVTSEYKKGLLWVRLPVERS